MKASANIPKIMEDIKKNIKGYEILWNMLVKFQIRKGYSDDKMLEMLLEYIKESYNRK